MCFWLVLIDFVFHPMCIVSKVNSCDLMLLKCYPLWFSFIPGTRQNIASLHNTEQRYRFWDSNSVVFSQYTAVGLMTIHLSFSKIQFSYLNQRVIPKIQTFILQSYSLKNTQGTPRLWNNKNVRLYTKLLSYNEVMLL